MLRMSNHAIGSTSTHEIEFTCLGSTEVCFLLWATCSMCITLSQKASRNPPRRGSLDFGPYFLRCTLATMPSKWSRKSWRTMSRHAKTKLPVLQWINFYICTIWTM